MSHVQPPPLLHLKSLELRGSKGPLYIRSPDLLISCSLERSSTGDKTLNTHFVRIQAIFTAATHFKPPSLLLGESARRNLPWERDRLISTLRKWHQLLPALCEEFCAMTYNRSLHALSFSGGSSQLNIQRFCLIRSRDRQKPERVLYS
jgi:hypothetical protein